MKRSTLRAALMTAAIWAPLLVPSAWADDAHHPAQGTAAQTQSTPQAATSAALSEPAIKALQEALNKQGIAVKVDSVLSDETRAAIRRYQTEHHLPVTGEPDRATLDKLGVVVARSAAPARPPRLAQAAPATPPAGSPPAATQPPQAPPQPGQMPGGMMMNCPMMQGQMQGMMQMMQTMQGQMQGMMQMMQTMQRQMQPGQMQPGAR